MEEFDLTTHDLLVRRVKVPSRISEAQWTYEVGEELKRAASEVESIAPSTVNVPPTQPYFFRKDTRSDFQWRVRNLPYSADVFTVTVDPGTGKITVRTSNKK